MTEAHKQVIRDLIGGVPSRVFQNPRYGKYYAGYGASDIFTCESFFDTVFLYVTGNDPDGEFAANVVRMHVAAQNPETGHIPRHILHADLDIETLDPPVWDPKCVFIDGGMTNPWHWYELEEIAQPFLWHAAALACRIKGSTEWMENRAYEGLKKYILCWLRDWDRAGDGLCVVGSSAHGISDNAFPRAGVWRSFYSELPDFNAFLYGELICAAKIAEAMGKAEDAAFFREQAAVKKDRINALLWDEEAGCYFPRDIRTGKLIKVDSINNYECLYEGIVPPERAARMVHEHLFNPAKFYTKYPFPAFAIDEPAYTQLHVNDRVLLDDLTLLPTGHCNWRGGCWAHPHFFLMFALPRYGFTAEALDVADKIYDLTIGDPYVSEWHNAETGERLGAVIPAGVQLFQRLMPTLIRSGFDIDFAGEDLTSPLAESPLPALLK